jgi:hypothetical protein
MKIQQIGAGLNVAPVRWALRAHPELWDQNTARTEHADSPHHGLSDIWARYAAPGDDGSQPHRSVWYPAADLLGIKAMCLDVMRAVDGEELGGVLITRIPPGAMCRPHVDRPGWHAEFYEKVAVQIESAPGQRFCFEGESLETRPGDVFWFDNAHTHWVTNDTNHERITLIVCVKTARFDQQKEVISCHG